MWGKQTQWWVVLLFAFGLVLLSPLASSFPDGLERVAEDLGFAVEEGAIYFRALLPDYTVPGLSHEALSSIGAGGVGVILAFGAALALGRMLARREAP